MMSGSVKLLDVRRDPRIAVHSPTIEPPARDPGAAPGDAKLAGTAVETAPPAGHPYQGAGFFKLDITEVALTYVGTPADRYGVVSTALKRNVAIAPLASSGALLLVLHWPLCEPDVYLGTYPAP